MPTKYNLGEIISCTMTNENGEVIATLDPSGFSKSFYSGGLIKRKLTNQEKLNPKNIKKVIFNKPATIVIFKDDTKVIAKTHNEVFDEEKGFMACMMQIMFNSRSEFNRLIDKGIEDSYKNIIM